MSLIKNLRIITALVIVSSALLLLPLTAHESEGTEPSKKTKFIFTILPSVMFYNVDVPGYSSEYANYLEEIEVPEITYYYVYGGRVQLDFIKNRVRGFGRVEIFWHEFTPNAPDETLRGLINGTFNLSYNLLPLKVLNLYLGFTIENNTTLLSDAILYRYDTFSTTTLGAAIIGEFIIGKHTLELNWYVPLVGISSLNAETEPVELGLRSWGNSFRTTINLTYRIGVLPSIGFVCHYGVSLDYYPELTANTQTDYVHQVGLGIAFY